MNKAFAILPAAAAIAYGLVRPSPSPPPLPNDARGVAAVVAAHPSNWAAASRLTGKALDAPAPDRRALWHASNDLAMAVAPNRPEPRNAFARSGFFHWSELSDAERQAVLEAYEPVLHDWMVFSRVYQAVFALTGDFAYLRRARPANEEATHYLAQLAAENGLFDDYRALRAELPGGVRTAKSVDERQVDAEHAVSVTVAAEQTDETPPYVEISVDGALRAEGIVVGQQAFTAPVASAGAHRLLIRLANPRTRNGVQRRVRVVSVQAR